MITLFDPLSRRLGRRDIKRDRQLTKRSLAPHDKAGALEDTQHRLVAEHHVRIEPVDPAVRSDRRELLEHPSTGAAALKIVGHRERDRGSARLAQPLEAGHRHHSAVMPGDQLKPIDTVRLRGCARGGIGPPTAGKPHITALSGQAIEELLDVLKIRRSRSLQPQRRPIPQQHIPHEPLRLTSRSGHHVACRDGLPTGDRPDPRPAAAHPDNATARHLAEPPQPVSEPLTIK